MLQAVWTLMWLRYKRPMQILASVLFLHCHGMGYRGVLAPNIVTVHHRGLFCAPEISLLVQLAFQDFVVRDICLLSVIVSRVSHFEPMDPLDPLDPTLLTNLLAETFWCLRIWEIYKTGQVFIRMIIPKANKQSRPNVNPFTTLYWCLLSWYLWLYSGILWNSYLRDLQLSKGSILLAQKILLSKNMRSFWPKFELQMHTKRQIWEQTSRQTVCFFWWIGFNFPFLPNIPTSPTGNHQRPEI